MNVDWRSYSLSQLLAAESKLSANVNSQSPAIAARAPTTGSTYVPTSSGNISLNSGQGSRYYDPSYRPSVGDHYVRGYTRSDGSYVPGHYKTNPDDSFWNNYSSYGNLNPYTGRTGYKLPPIGGGYGGSSYVNGYTRRDGTYVSGHYRSR